MLKQDPLLILVTALPALEEMVTMFSNAFKSLVEVDGKRMIRVLVLSAG